MRPMGGAVKGIITLALAAVLGACAAGSRAEPASPQSQPGYAQAPTAAAPPPPSAPPGTPETSPKATSQPAGGAPQPVPQQRALALQSAANEVETSQRELDVAAGDCRNACRALGSMDRATGRLCGLTQGDTETRRCDDARQRVYSARDRVKATCGQCEGGPSVERSAPIPSLR